jgi:3-oxoacyl-[acyl-carrier protein] reductase
VSGHEKWTLSYTCCYIGGLDEDERRKDAMTDRYQDFASSPLGKLLVKNLRLPNPVRLDRYVAGSPLVVGTVAVGGSGRLAGDLPKILDGLGIATTTTTEPGSRYQGLVFDATRLTDPTQLVALRDFFAPLMRSVETCSRLVVIGTPPEDLRGEERVAQRALEGFTRSLGKEVGRGGTSQLVYVADGAEAAVASTLGFLLSPKSAYVSGQVVRVGTREKEAAESPDWRLPLAGKVALVTGAARGIGEQIARVLARDGATVIGVDVPQAADDLIRLTKELDGDHLTLDITAKDAPQRIAQHLRQAHGGVDVVVHNAGITRDKRLANMDEERWNAVLGVNLVAPERITEELLAQGVIHDNGRIVGVASIAGIAGNVGQTNYATSKAGVIGLVDSLEGGLERGITVNAVAPGFIETQMTAAVPFATREVGRRMNAMSQGGRPVDVAETIAWFANPASTAVTGNVVRVCGQMMLGA